MAPQRLTPAAIRSAAETYIAEAAWDELGLATFGRRIGLSNVTIDKAIHPRRWRDFVTVERQTRVDRAVTALQADGVLVSQIAVAAHLRVAPGRIAVQYRRAPRARVVPTSERLQSAIDTVIDRSHYREHAFIADVRAIAGANLTRHPDLSAQFWRRRAELPPRPREPLDPSLGIQQPTGTAPLLRANLRDDIADVVWPRFVAEAGRPGRAESASRQRFYGFQAAGRLLGEAVPDVRLVTLEGIQAAWLTSRLSDHTRKRARIALREILEILVFGEVEAGDDGRDDAAQAAEWLAQAAVREPRSQDRALSAEESDAVVAACRTVIEEARSETRDTDICFAAAAVPAAADWGLALLILVGRFTGLRTESLSSIRIEDLFEVGPSTFAVVWRHGKKLEERLAFVPSSLATLLLEYASSLSTVRATYGLTSLFVGPSTGSTWTDIGTTGLAQRLGSFVRRRIPTLQGSGVFLSPLLLRRTFATRALAEGRSIYAVAAQLGHASISTTLIYVRYDRRAHPAEVSPALDRFGRVVLDRWKCPILLDDLPDEERGALMADATAHDCSVGLCRKDLCAFVEAGDTPPPCQACAHLVTGPAFFPAWELDLDRRRSRVASLAADAASGTVAAAESVQLAEIERIFTDLRARA